MLWLFLPFVMVVSGVVAYAADKIAKQVGRRHVRWFGLRPKQTATIVAVLSGVGISAASLAAFLLLNHSAVNTIAEADQLRPKIEALNREVKSVQGDLNAVKLERNAARQDAERLDQERTQALGELQAARGELARAQQAQAKIEQQRRELGGKVSALTKLQKDLEAQAGASRSKLAQSENALRASQLRAQMLDAQVLDLSLRSATAEQEAQIAQTRATASQQQAEQAQAKAAQAQASAKAAQTKAQAAQAQAAAASQSAQAQVRALSTQLAALKQAAQAATTAKQVALAALGSAKAASTQAQIQQRAALAQRERLVAERDQLTIQRDSLSRERDFLTQQRNQLTLQRAQATKDRDQVRSDLNTLKNQQTQLRASNAALQGQLSGARQALDQLRTQFSSTRSELSASRNTELAYPKNDLVYAGVVPSVRNLDTFLNFAAQTAEARGARGNDQGAAARLDSASRTALENQLRGLNTSSFVLCRANQNSSAGFPVNLSCDARPNSVLYHAGQTIRQATISISEGGRGASKSTQAQISELVQDAVMDLTSRGVPLDHIDNQGLDVTEFANLLSKLDAKTGKVAVKIMARDEVKPASRVDLYAELP